MNYCEPADPSRACDLNGNFYAVEDPKNSVFQILTDTLRRSPPSLPTTTTTLGGLTCTSHSQLSEKGGYTSVDILNDTTMAEDCDSNLSFNPGDKLSSPIPPLAPPHFQLSFQNENSERNFSPEEEELGTKASNRSYHPSDPSKTTTEPSPPTVSLRSQFKQCHLATVLGSASRCFKQLSSVKEGLAILVSQDEQLSKGKKVTTGGRPDYALIATLGEYILFLTRQAFTPAHRLYTSSLGLHMSEDLIRNPNDPSLLNFKAGYISRPSWNSIIHTQMKLRSCVDSATEMYHRFGREANSSGCLGREQMQLVLVTLMHGFQDLYATALGSTDIFKVLLHIEDYGERILQEFLLSLESLERSDLLLQVQALRRSFDDIVIMMEQLSWAAYIVFRLASGKSLTPSPDGSNSKILADSSTTLPTTKKGGETVVVVAEKSKSQTSHHHHRRKQDDDSQNNCDRSSVSRSKESRDRDHHHRSSSKDKTSSSSSSKSSSKISSPTTTTSKPTTAAVSYSDSNHYSSQLVRGSPSRQSQKCKSGDEQGGKGQEKSKQDKWNRGGGGGGRHGGKSFIPTPTSIPQNSSSTSRKSSPNSSRPHTPDSTTSSYSRHHSSDKSQHKHSSQIPQHGSSRSGEDKRSSSSSSGEHKSGKKNKSKSRSSSRESSSRDKNSSKEKVGYEHQHHHHSRSHSVDTSVKTKDKDKDKDSSHKRSSKSRGREGDEAVVKFGKKF